MRMMTLLKIKNLKINVRVKIKKKEVIGNPQTYRAIKKEIKTKIKIEETPMLKQKIGICTFAVSVISKKFFGVFLYTYLKLDSYCEHIHKTNLIFLLRKLCLI